MRAWALSILAVAALAVWHGTTWAQPSVTLHERDGIRAEVSVDDAAVLVRWRFGKPLAAPLDDVSATINGRPLGVPAIEPYPAPGQITASIALLDATGLDRKDDIDRFKVAMVLLATRKSSNDAVAFAVYGLNGRLLAPQSDDPNEVVSLLARIPPLEEEANLSGALILTMRTLETVAATRRAIFVFTDGHNDSETKLASLADLARTTGTAVTFIVSPSSRTADAAALAQFAEATGGQIVEAKDIAGFLDDPFALTNSGAQVRFPLAGARRFFWESDAELKIVFRYGEGRFEIASKAPVPAASFGETISHPAGLFTTGGIAVAFIGLGFYVRSRRRRVPIVKRSVPPAAAPPATFQPATLQDIKSGVAYPLRNPLNRIGRNSDNEIVLQVPTVGRFHAVVQRVDELNYSITDQSSANGTFVNDRKIDTATLADGDLVTVGDITLRFKAPPQGRSR